MIKITVRSILLMICVWMVSDASHAQDPVESVNEVTNDAASEQANVAADSSEATAVPRESAGDSDDSEQVPWDYDPYRVLIWYISDQGGLSLSRLEGPIRDFLDRDFQAIWRVDLEPAPSAVASLASRDISNLSYDLITASDPVLAVKRDHPNAVRIRVAKNVGDYVEKVLATRARIDEVIERSSAVGNQEMDGVAKKLEVHPGDAFAVKASWSDPKTEAVLVSRGMANTLTEPQAKLIIPQVAGLVSKVIDNYDKIFIVSVKASTVPMSVEVVEFDTLMRHFGPVSLTHSTTQQSLPRAIGLGLTKAFAPVVRIENAGQRSALGLVRAGGLVLEKDREDSPAWIRTGDVLEPMTRKNDRNNNPIMVGPLDWAYLHVKELDGHRERNVQMDFYSGRGGGLQGRKNKRTFRTALKVRPMSGSTVLRLHLQRKPDFPLIGYELYEKNLETGDMTFVGRTNWNGLLNVENTDDPMRLLYVKNGGAILARLPMVPGLYSQVVADLSGDDIRLQAEAYIRGVQNSIIDLVAVRELFKARIRMRLEKGEMKKAEDLLNALREQPSSDNLSRSIEKKQTEFINLLGTKNANQSRKVDEMFTTTRDLLSKHIRPDLIRNIENDLGEARKQGGRLPPRSEEPKVDNSADGGEDDPKPSAASSGSETKKK